MIYAFPILVLFGLFIWYTSENLRELLQQQAERADEVGVDGTSPNGLGLANTGQGTTATVGADTSPETR